MLYIIGVGLGDEKDVSLRGLEIIKECDKVYLESYTSKLQCNIENLTQLYGKRIILADRDVVEGDEDKDQNPILEAAKTKIVALLVIGDPMGATTHIDMLLRCKRHGIEVKVVHNTSILNAVGIVGLELYKYGKTTSVPFPQESFKPETAYDVIKENKKYGNEGLHTLCLLDLRPLEGEGGRFMSVNKAIKILIEIGEKRVKEEKESKSESEKVFCKDTFCIGCARIGTESQLIVKGTAEDLLNVNFGEAPHCLIVPGKMHFMEEEAMKLLE